VIDAGACTLCYLCERFCLHDAIRFADKEFHLDKTACVSCGLCCSLCPVDALELRPGGGGSFSPKSAGAEAE
jgi:MinD superfamily P-loop ATPase